MTAITRLGDLNTGHDACAPTALNSASKNVFVNGKAVGRVGDTYVAHGCISHSSHIGVIASGSPTVFVNGKPVGRIGDSVSCGGTVAQGSPNVICDESIKSEYSYDAFKTKVTLWGQANGVNKTILTLPNICREEAKRESDLNDKQGWIYLAQMFDRYLANSYKVCEFNESAFQIDIEWLLSFDYVKDVSDELINAINNSLTKKRLNYLLNNKFLLNDGQVYDFSSNKAQWLDLYINSRPVKHILELLNHGLSGLTIAMGSFNLRALPKVKIEQKSDDLYVTITDLYIFASDSFNFEGTNLYAYWSYINNDFSISPLDEVTYTLLSNSNFKNFEKSYNKGEEFKILSNLHKVEDFTPISFKID